MLGTRLGLSIILVLGGLFSPITAEAQQATKIARIGYLATNLAGRPPGSHEAFLEGLRDLGYVEGRNVVIEYRDAEGKDDRLPALAAELVGLKVEPGLVSIDEENPIGVHHFCLDMEADSMDDLIADLRQAGVGISRGPMERRDGTSVFVHDPDGVRVELPLAK